MSFSLICRCWLTCSCFFKTDVGWTRDVGASKPESQNKWRLFINKGQGLQMTVPSERLEPVKFGREFIKKNKSLVQNVKLSQKTFNDKKEAWERVKRGLA